MLDMAPTLLDLAGAKVPPDIQGQSLKPLLLGQQTHPCDIAAPGGHRGLVHLFEIVFSADILLRQPQFRGNHDRFPMLTWRSSRCTAWVESESMVPRIRLRGHREFDFRHHI
jgi:hypothetical protein